MHMWVYLHSVQIYAWVWPSVKVYLHHVFENFSSCVRMQSKFTSGMYIFAHWVMSLSAVCFLLPCIIQAKSKFKRLHIIWLGREMVLGSFQCRWWWLGGVLLLWHNVGHGPAVLAAGAGQVAFCVFVFLFFGGFLFVMLSILSFLLKFLMPHLLWDWNIRSWHPEVAWQYSSLTSV